jgi:P-type E1-E2 ATPase
LEKIIIDDIKNCKNENRNKKNTLPFCFIGVFGLKDPIRKNVNGFVQWGRNHGNLSLRMLSGDHKNTATAVALKCGILRQEE